MNTVNLTGSDGIPLIWVRVVRPGVLMRFENGKTCPLLGFRCPVNQVALVSDDPVSGWMEPYDEAEAAKLTAYRRRA